jgi:hypothetical protein
LQQFYPLNTGEPGRNDDRLLSWETMMQVAYFVRTIEKAVEMPSKSSSLTNSRRDAFCAERGCAMQNF